MKLPVSSSSPSSSPKARSAVSNTIFSVVVVILIVAAAAGFGLYGTNASKTVTTQNTVTVTASTEVMMTTDVTMINHTSSGMPANYAYQFNPASGAMVSSAWLLDVPVGMHEYAVSIHAEGLEPNGTYIVEGNLASGSMSAVPISSQSMNMNTTSASEFQADQNGTANYWIVLDGCPSTIFESVQLLFLPGMQMSNATTVATIHFAMMTNMTTESMMTHAST